MPDDEAPFKIDTLSGIRLPAGSLVVIGSSMVDTGSFVVANETVEKAFGWADLMRPDE